MRPLPLCAASVLSFSASADVLRERPSAAASSIVIVQNGSVQALEGDVRASLVADAVDSVTIAIAICDDSGRPIADLPVRVEVTGSRNFVTPDPTSFTDVNGLYIANLTTTAAETKAISVIADPGPAEVLLEDLPSVVFRAGPPVHSEVPRDFFGNPTATNPEQ
jgi:hypothetical protein